MEEKNNQIKVKLTTMIVLIIIAIIIIIGIVALILNKKAESKTSEVEEEKTTQTEEVEQNTTSSNADSNDTEFALKFLKMENKEENMVYSPLSIKYALKMLSDGASGNTKTQIENAIGNANLIKYNNIDNILSLANAIYIRDSYSKYIK